MKIYSDPVQQEYAGIASKYDRRWSFYINTTISETLNRLQKHQALRIESNPNPKILDLGCGTGILIEKLLTLFPQAEVYGIDPCQEMLEIARQRLPRAVDLKLGNAEGLDWGDNSFDMVISTNAFHYFRNPKTAIQEAQRVLKPNSCLVITDWCHDYLTCNIYDLFMRRFNAAHFRTYNTGQLEVLLTSQGMSTPIIERYKINWFWGLMTAIAINPHGK